MNKEKFDLSILSTTNTNNCIRYMSSYTNQNYMILDEFQSTRCRSKIMGSLDNLHIVVLSTILIIHLHGFRTTAKSGYVSQLCQGGNYTANSKYHANLKLLLASLSSNSRPIKENRYYNDTIGQKPDAAYGSFQCRGDAPFKVCQDCVTKAVQEILDSERCPNSKQGIFWFLDCMFRYSNEYFFAIMDTTPATFLWKEGNVSKPGQFNKILDILMGDLVTQAVSNGSSPTWFATGEITYSGQKRYGLVQCCSDLSNASCGQCLQVGVNEIRKCCDGKGGGIVLLPTCFFRYETSPFYGLETEPAPSPPVLPRPQSTNATMTNTKRKKSSKTVVIIVVILVIALFIVLSTTIWYFCLERRMKMKNAYDDIDEIQSAESWQFNFSTIRTATDNFSDANKLGEGGFGSVYKGTLSDGQRIAVKRLSKCSGQGEQEFKNEVVLVAKLQHRNLVRLLGFCLYGEEKLLIYEFMLNASLDQFIFDPIKRTHLDWEKRYKIIIGIARGLVYLHEDSRLRIIHRDLKASNILLGADMSPKISDFGMAKMFLMDQTQASTNRIVGTYGYMAPEYAMHGQFSVKSDVFSFGVLVLEILSGRRNNSFCELDDVQDLLTYTWRHWQEDTTLELLDPTLREHYTASEVMRCIQIGLLCVQEYVAHRPTMASIVYNLNNQFVALPSPSSPPAFFVDSNQASQVQWSVNEASFTKLCPR